MPALSSADRRCCRLLTLKYGSSVKALRPPRATIQWALRSEVKLVRFFFLLI